MATSSLRCVGDSASPRPSRVARAPEQAGQRRPQLVGDGRQQVVLETLSRELGVEAHRLAAWRDDFLEGGKDALKGQRPDRSPDDRALRRAERKVGQLTMENEIRGRPPKKGGCRSRRRGAGSGGCGDAIGQLVRDPVG
jgi:transposase-like protein